MKTGSCIDRQLLWFHDFFSLALSFIMIDKERSKEQQAIAELGPDQFIGKVSIVI